MPTTPATTAAVTVTVTVKPDERSNPADAAVVSSLAACVVSAMGASKAVRGEAGSGGCVAAHAAPAALLEGVAGWRSPMPPVRPSPWPAE